MTTGRRQLAENVVRQLKAQRKRYDIYIVRGCIERGASFSDVVFRTTALGYNRREAVESVLPAIRMKVLPLVRDETIRRVAIYAGEKGSVTARASRLDPLRVDVGTGKLVGR